MPDDDYDLAPDPIIAPKPVTRAPTSVAAPTTGSGAFVRGNLLVVKDGAALPDRCIKCNAPANDGRTSKRFAFNESTEGPGAARLIPLFGRIIWLVWLIGQMRSRQYVTVSFCLCKAHRTRRGVAIGVMAIGMLAGAGVLVLGITNQSMGMGIAGFWIFLVGGLCGLAANTLSIATTLNNGLELKGAGSAFLEAMPRGGFGKSRI